MAKVEIVRAEVDGDRVTVAGVVDGVECRVVVWKSHLDQLGSKRARQQYVARELRRQADRERPKERVDLVGTVNV